MDTSNLSGYVRARPIRVAFLVEDDGNASDVLEAVFADCYSRWGGRFSLIVPCENGAIRPEWSKWLEVYDADIIYSYARLSDETVIDLNERLGPSHLKLHEPITDRIHASRYWVPQLPMHCLSSLSVALKYARLNPASSPRPILVPDYPPGEEWDDFVVSNFGTPYASFGAWPLQDSLADSVRSIMLTTEQNLIESRYRLRDGQHIAHSTTALLKFMATHRNSFGISQLSADETPRIDLSRYDGSFTLVVGDSFHDRLLFWYLRHFAPSYIGRECFCLLVSPDRFTDPDFVNALVEFIKARSGVQQSNSTPHVKIASIDTDKSTLDAIHRKLNDIDRWNTYSISSISKIDDLIPASDSLERYKALVTGRIFNHRTTWKRFELDGPTVHPPAPLIAHLQGIQTPSRATAGLWAIDLDLERETNHSRYSNVRNRWLLPRRLRMTGAFLRPYQGRLNNLCTPRTTVEGHLTAYLGFDEECPAVTLPDDDVAFHYAIQQGNDWQPPSPSKAAIRGENEYRWSRPSDKGRYLLGTLRLFGDLQIAGRILLHPFWMSVFERLGAVAGADRRDEIRQKLHKKLKSGTIETEAEWERLARLVETLAREIRTPSKIVDFDELKSIYEPLLAKERENLQKHRIGSDHDYWIERAEKSLPVSVASLCRAKVIHQGYTWRCTQCFHTNWNPIDTLKPQLRCDVCGKTRRAPVNRAWDFRLNGFVLEALKEHGLLALIWTLIRLENSAKNTFYFLGPSELFDDYPHEQQIGPTNEIDLLCVVDGEVHLCEVKSSERDIAIDPIVTVAKRIRPDVVTLGVMADETPRLRSKLTELTSKLSDSGIRANLLTLEDLDDLIGHAALEEIPDD
ncbi:MAG: hypothetical protein QM744_02815 [Mesorhizobium sp.]